MKYPPEIKKPIPRDPKERLALLLQPIVPGLTKDQIYFGAAQVTGQEAGALSAPEVVTKIMKGETPTDDDWDAAKIDSTVQTSLISLKGPAIEDPQAFFIGDFVLNIVLNLPLIELKNLHENGVGFIVAGNITQKLNGLSDEEFRQTQATIETYWNQYKTTGVVKPAAIVVTPGALDSLKEKNNKREFF